MNLYGRTCFAAEPEAPEFYSTPFEEEEIDRAETVDLIGEAAYAMNEAYIAMGKDSDFAAEALIQEALQKLADAGYVLKVVA